ncbi:MAG: beta-lactamase family protein, partial [Deltaproteobacteria bacterium]|nr:beta-lactamase family protein [Deltaproteobacteria bacterium]
SDRDVAAIWRRVESWYRSGLCPTIALCVRRRGRIVLDRSIGAARGAAGGQPEPASPDGLFGLFSASKMVVGVLVHQACGRGELELDAPVADYVPEFGSAGKTEITVRDVLAHRSGVTALGEPTTLELLNDWDRIMSNLCRARPRLQPGRLGYHALSGGYILGEVVERVTGLSLNQLIERDIAGPLGLDHFRYGASRDVQPSIAENLFTGLRVPAPLRPVVESALGISAEDATRLSNAPRFYDAIVPAGNLVTTAEQACRFMEALRRGGELDGVRIIEEAHLRAALAEHSHLELDNTLLLPVRYGLGFMLGGRVFSPYGLDTKEVFGHVGFTQVLLWADPVREVSGALLTSGKTFLSPGLLHFPLVMQTIARRCR